MNDRRVDNSQLVDVYIKVSGKPTVRVAIEQLLKIKTKVTYQEIAEYCKLNISTVVDVLVANALALNIDDDGYIKCFVNKESYCSYLMYLRERSGQVYKVSSGGEHIDLNYYSEKAFFEKVGIASVKLVKHKIKNCESNIKLLHEQGILDYDTELALMKEHHAQLVAEWKE
jgi:hypothetical protein